MSNRLYLTNNYSILSKWSAIQSNYYDDPLLDSFLTGNKDVKSIRRTSLVNRGYAARLLAVDQAVHQLRRDHNIDCFIILGAGYDTLPFRKERFTNHHDRDKGVYWIELDLPQVVEVKIELLAETRQLHGLDILLCEGNYYQSTDQYYTLVSCDLRNTEDLKESLNKVVRSFQNIPNHVIAINEVCLCYLESSEVLRILTSLRELFTRLDATTMHYLGFEQVKPYRNTQFSRVMIDHFETIGHPLKFFPDCNTLEHLLRNEIGFTNVNIESLHDVYHHKIPELAHTQGFKREAFDEFEELESYLSHYAIVYAYSKLGRDGSIPYVDVDHCPESKVPQEKKQWSRQIAQLVPCPVRSYGLSNCVLGDGQTILINGGFGFSLSNPDSHKRIENCKIVRFSSEDTLVEPLRFEDLPAGKPTRLDRMHSQLVLVNPQTNLVFFNGGRQSPSKHSEGNFNFLATVDLEHHRLSLTHKFNCPSDNLSWRHAVSRCSSNQHLLQVGGLNLGDQSKEISPVIRWDFSSDKLGCEPVFVEDASLFKRHSFGMAMQDANTVLILGGLNSGEPIERQTLVSENSVGLLWDLRSRGQAVKLSLKSGSCFGCQVHFISDHQFLRIGGINKVFSKDTMGFDQMVYLVDLRNRGEIKAELSEPNHTESPFLLHNFTSCRLEETGKIITIGGGGSYFTFGSHFNTSSLMIKYREALCSHS